MLEKLDSKVVDLINRLGVKVFNFDDYEKLTGYKFPFWSNGCYDIAQDVIAISGFVMGDVNQVTLHEIMHWSGHADRADRFMIADAIKCGTTNVISKESQANEEAIAEMGMYKLACYLGLDTESARLARDRYLKMFPHNQSYCEAEADRSVDWIIENAYGENRKVA